MLTVIQGLQFGMTIFDDNLAYFRDYKIYSKIKIKRMNKMKAKRKKEKNPSQSQSQRVKKIYQTNKK